MIEAAGSISSLQQALDTWNTKIDLDDGWNMFGYGCPEAINLIDGVSNYSELIMIVKDDWGLAYIPEYGFNGIGDLTPGAGYQIKLSQAIDNFSLCDWYVNDIPEDNIVSLQDSLVLINSHIGCTDSLACNFDLSHMYEDSSCEYPEQGYDCDGNELQVGDFAFGGMIFYIDEAGHGLVATMEEFEPMNWESANTLAANYNIGVYEDWYMPSLDELNEMYNTIGPGGPNGNIGNFAETEYLYWSSTPSYSYFNNGNYTGVYFDDQGQSNNSLDVNLSLRVRPIRSF